MYLSRAGSDGGGVLGKDEEASNEWRPDGSSCGNFCRFETEPRLKTSREFLSRDLDVDGVVPSAEIAPFPDMDPDSDV